MQGTTDLEGSAAAGPAPRLRPVAGGRADHDATPVMDSARLLDGTPADLTRPSHYPCEAVCQACAGPIRCDRWFRASFYHISAFTLPVE